MLVWLLIHIPVGVHPDLYKEYESNIDELSNTFKCLDGSGVIQLNQLNDGILDCDDGSDEPGTSVGKGTFYCPNQGYVPSFIERWSVNDGKCDCCDCSDEWETNATTKATCSDLESKRVKLLKEVQKHYAKGLKEKENLESMGRKELEKYKKDSESIDARIDEIEKSISRLELTKTETNTTEESDTETEEKVEENDTGFKRYIKLLWKFTFHVPDVRSSLKNSVTEKRIKELEDEKETLEERRRKLGDYKDIDEDEDPGLVAMMGKEFTDGKMSLKVMKELKDDYRTIGRHKKYTGSSMVFKDGDYCWQISGSRSGVLDVVCWDENKLIGVMETETCKYTGIFASPIGCNQSSLDTLSYKDLKKIIKRIK